jgi:hypothetical protein
LLEPCGDKEILQLPDDKQADYFLDWASSLFTIEGQNDFFYLSVVFVMATYSFDSAYQIPINTINQWVKSYYNKDNNYVFNKPKTPLVDGNPYKLLIVLLKSFYPYEWSCPFNRFKGFRGLRKISREWKQELPLVDKYVNFIYFMHMQEAPKVIWDNLITIVEFYLDQASIKQIKMGVEKFIELNCREYLKDLLDFFKENEFLCEKSNKIRQILQETWDDSLKNSPCNRVKF